MSQEFRLVGERVVLRDWRDADVEAFARLNADPRVRRYFTSTLTFEESAAQARRIRSQIAEKGWGFWVLELPGVADFAGVTGLFETPYQAHFTPCIEAAWRLSPEFWGRGYVTEGARLALDYGFETLDQSRLVALTAVDNQPSRAVMERLGMRCDRADDFDHPNVPEGHPLRRHVLYRLDRTEWRAQRAQQQD